MASPCQSAGTITRSWRIDGNQRSYHWSDFGRVFRLLYDPQTVPLKTAAPTEKGSSTYWAFTRRPLSNRIRSAGVRKGKTTRQKPCEASLADKNTK